MDISGLTSVTTKDQLITWMTDNLVTPVSPAISASDFGAILEKMADILGAGDTLSADNGLGIVKVGSGPTARNFVELGGTLRTDTTIGLEGRSLIFSGTQNNTTSIGIGDQSGDPYIALTVTDTTDIKSVLTLVTEAVKLQYKDRAIVFDDFRMVIADDTIAKGLENAGDFEANFTARSLVTKQYVDGLTLLTTLAGYVPGAGTIAATDNILQAIEKLAGNDALKAPLASPVLTGSPSVNQANQPTVSTGSGANAPAVFIVQGGDGGSSTSSGSIASGGNGSEINISSGNGGNSFGAAGTGIGGSGGDITLSAGRGGNVSGTTGAGYPGSGGGLSLAGGVGGTHVNNSGPGGPVHISGGAGGMGNSVGGSVYISPGTGNGTGISGTIFLGYNSAGGHQGNVVIGSSTDDYAHVLQVTGPAIFSSLTAKINKRVLALSANSATPAVNTDNYDVVHITAQTATITGFVMTGTPVDGDTLRISVTGTASVPFTLGASFEPSGGVALSTTTQGTHRLDMGFVWNTETSKWRQIAVA